MSIASRLARAEAHLPDAILWRECRRMAGEDADSPQRLFAEAQALLQKYGGTEVTLPGGRVDFEPMVRAIADGEGLDYEELMQESRRNYRRLSRRLRR